MRARRLGRLGVCLALGAMLSVAGCRGAGVLGPAAAPTPEEYPIFYQKMGKYCGAQQPLRLVVRDEAHMAYVPVEVGSPVDFGKQMVLFVTMGQVYSDAYNVQIDRIWRQGQLIKVALTETFPAPGGVRAPQPCSPYALVVVPRSDLNVDGFVADPPPPKPSPLPSLVPE